MTVSAVRTLRLVLCGFYWLALTVLLLVPDPAGVLRMRRIPVFPWGDVGIHFTAFTVLTLLVCAVRWPKPIGWLVFLLLAYAVATESLQALVPPRAVELKDYAENILGIAVGSGLYCCLRRAMHQAGARDAPPEGAKTPSLAADTAAD